MTRLEGKPDRQKLTLYDLRLEFSIESLGIENIQGETMVNYKAQSGDKLIAYEKHETLEVRGKSRIGRPCALLLIRCADSDPPDFVGWS